MNILHLLHLLHNYETEKDNIIFLDGISSKCGCVSFRDVPRGQEDIDLL